MNRRDNFTVLLIDNHLIFPNEMMKIIVRIFLAILFKTMFIQWSAFYFFLIFKQSDHNLSLIHILNNYLLFYLFPAIFCSPCYFYISCQILKDLLFSYLLFYSRYIYLLYLSLFCQYILCYVIGYICVIDY